MMMWLHPTAERVSATNEEMISCDDAAKVPHIATILQAVMDKRFIEDNKDFKFWVDFREAVDSEGEPLGRNTWYKINRGSKSIEKSSKEEFDELKWHERLVVPNDAIQSIEGQKPLILAVGDSPWDSLALMGYNWYYTRAVQVETEQTQRNISPNDLLRDK